MSLDNQDFTVKEASDLVLKFEDQDDPVGIDLSAVTVAVWRMGLSWTPDAADVEYTLAGGGITKISEETALPGKTGTVDKLKVTIAAADTVGLGGTTSVNYVHELRVTDASGATSVFAHGSATIEASNTG